MRKYLFTLSFLFFSCSGNDKKSHTNYGGETNNIFGNDSIKYEQFFYENGKIASEGNFWKDSLQIGLWKYYDSLGYLSSIAEHFKLGNTTYFNQRWRLNQKGDTIGGSYFTYEIEDTIKVDTDSRAFISLTRPVISNDSYAYVCLPMDDEDLKPDFSNENKIKWDTIPNVAEFYGNNEKYKTWKTDIVFDFQSTSLGQKRLRGFVLEKDTVNVDSFDFVTRKIYFDIPYYVKDSIE